MAEVLGDRSKGAVPPKKADKGSPTKKSAVKGQSNPKISTQNPQQPAVKNQSLPKISTPKPNPSHDSTDLVEDYNLDYSAAEIVEISVSDTISLLLSSLDLASHTRLVNTINLNYVKQRKEARSKLSATTGDVEEDFSAVYEDVFQGAHEWYGGGGSGGAIERMIGELEGGFGRIGGLVERNLESWEKASEMASDLNRRLKRWSVEVADTVEQSEVLLKLTAQKRAEMKNMSVEDADADNVSTLEGLGNQRFQRDMRTSRISVNDHDVDVEIATNGLNGIGHPSTPKVEVFPPSPSTPSDPSIEQYTTDAQPPIGESSPKKKKKKKSAKNKSLITDPVKQIEPQFVQATTTAHNVLTALTAPTSTTLTGPLQHVASNPGPLPIVFTGHPNAPQQVVHQPQAVRAPSTVPNKGAQTATPEPEHLPKPFIKQSDIPKQKSIQPAHAPPTAPTKAAHPVTLPPRPLRFHGTPNTLLPKAPLYYVPEYIQAQNIPTSMEEPRLNSTLHGTPRIVTTNSTLVRGKIASIENTASVTEAPTINRPLARIRRRSLRHGVSSDAGATERTNLGAQNQANGLAEPLEEFIGIKEPKVNEGIIGYAKTRFQESNNKLTPVVSAIVPGQQMIAKLPAQVPSIKRSKTLAKPEDIADQPNSRQTVDSETKRIAEIVGHDAKSYEDYKTKYPPGSVINYGDAWQMSQYTGVSTKILHKMTREQLVKLWREKRPERDIIIEKSPLATTSIIIPTNMSSDHFILDGIPGVNAVSEAQALSIATKLNWNIDLARKVKKEDAARIQADVPGFGFPQNIPPRHVSQLSPMVQPDLYVAEDFASRFDAEYKVQLERLTKEKAEREKLSMANSKAHEQIANTVTRLEKEAGGKGEVNDNKAVAICTCCSCLIDDEPEEMHCLDGEEGHYCGFEAESHGDGEEVLAVTPAQGKSVGNNNAIAKKDKNKGKKKKKKGKKSHVF